MAYLFDNPLRVREEMLNHPMGNLVPIVVEKSGTRGTVVRHLLAAAEGTGSSCSPGGVDDMEANVIIAQLLFLSNEDNKADINFYINSPGRVGDGGVGDLRHDAVPAVRRGDDHAWDWAASMGAWAAGGGARRANDRPCRTRRSCCNQPLIGGVMQGDPRRICR